MKHLAFPILWVHRHEAIKSAFRFDGCCVSFAKLQWNYDLSGSLVNGELFPLSGVCNLNLVVSSERKKSDLEPELRGVLKPYLYGQGAYLA